VTERHSIALRLEEQARTDSLTGLANRRRFDDAIQAEWSRSARDCIPISLILLDVDHFKRFNDQYGHQAGDECLRAVAAAIRNAIRRPGDIAARYGGEEFAVILPATDRDAGARVAEQVRAAIEALSLPHAENAGVGVVTASLGLATMLPVACAESPGPMNLIAAADAVLYAAKSGGRNRVCME
jgi:diguanylate cyclase (GGDEF)-like protein